MRSVSPLPSMRKRSSWQYRPVAESRNEARKTSRPKCVEIRDSVFRHIWAAGAHANCELAGESPSFPLLQRPAPERLDQPAARSPCCRPFILYQYERKRCLLAPKGLPHPGPWYGVVFHFWKTFGKTPYDGMVTASLEIRYG